MPSAPVKPWWRADRNAWYVCHKGKQVMLAKGKNSKAEANRALAKLLLEPLAQLTTRGHKVTLKELIDAWLDRSKNVNDDLTYRRHEWTSRSFLAHVGGSLPADQVHDGHVTSWISSRKWGLGTRVTNVAVIKSAFGYGERRGLVETNPCAGINYGSAPPRALMMSPGQSRAVIEATGHPPWEKLGHLIRLMHATGMRPTEAIRLEASFFNEDYSKAVIEKHKRRRRVAKHRVVRFPTTIRPLVKRLCEENPAGPILRTNAGTPWTHKCANSAIERLRKKLGFGRECVLESFRHEYITDALQKGVPAATVAELCGTSVAMIARHYSKISQREEHLDASVESVR